MAKSNTPKRNENPICRDCRQECKQTDTVIVLNCAKYRRKDEQLKLNFAMDRGKNKRKKEEHQQ